MSDHKGDNLGSPDVPEAAEPDQTQAFTVAEIAEAVSPATPAPGERAAIPWPAGEPQECRCDECKYRQGPRETGKEALLYYGPGIADRTWETRVRNGQWDDIPAEFDAAGVRVHMPAIQRVRHIGRDLDGGLHHLAAVFSAEPGMHFDAGVAEQLRQLEAGLAAQLVEMRLAAEREQAKRNEAEGQVAA